MPHPIVQDSKSLVLVPNLSTQAHHIQFSVIHSYPELFPNAMVPCIPYLSNIDLIIFKQLSQLLCNCYLALILALIVMVT